MGALNQLADRWRHRLMGIVSDDFTSHMQRVGVSYVDVKITAAELDALNATPKELVAAPGSGKILECLGILAKLDFQATGLELGSGTLDCRYQNSSGGLAAQITNAFTEGAADAYYKAVGRDVVALVNQALVLHASADVTAGDSILYLRVYYRTVAAVEVDPSVL